MASDKSAFVSNFSDEERKTLMEDDREAQLSICAILAVLIAMGMILGIISVLLISRLGV
jgi:hypothetical protein